jgi:hypothetical protein
VYNIPAQPAATALIQLHQYGHKIERKRSVCYWNIKLRKKGESGSWQHKKSTGKLILFHAKFKSILQYWLLNKGKSVANMLVHKQNEIIHTKYIFICILFWLQIYGWITILYIRWHLIPNYSIRQCFSNFQQSQTTSWTVSIHADHLRKIPHTQKCMQVNRRNIKPVVQVTITVFYRLIYSIFWNNVWKTRSYGNK